MSKLRELGLPSPFEDFKELEEKHNKLKTDFDEARAEVERLKAQVNQLTYELDKSRDSHVKRYDDLKAQLSELTGTNDENGERAFYWKNKYFEIKAQLGIAVDALRLISLDRDHIIPMPERQETEPLYRSGMKSLAEQALTQLEQTKGG